MLIRKNKVIFKQITVLAREKRKEAEEVYTATKTYL